MTKSVTDFLLYRWRYVLGYSLVGVILAVLLILTGLYSPGGLTAAEMTSAIKASLMSYGHFDPAMVINLPFSLLQKASFAVFGVTTLSIKLPSLVLGFLSIVGLLPLLVMWFRQNVSLITIALVVTSGQFLFIAQSGTANILYIFYAVWILLAATMISRHAQFLIVWKILLFILAALSLYTPLSIYMFIAMFLATVFHPHLRYLIKRLNPAKTAAAAALSVVIIAPLVYAVIQNPAIGLTLLGIPPVWLSPISNIVMLYQQYFDFVTPHSGEVMNPVYGMGSMALVLLGIFRLFSTKYTARSYIISAWFLFIVPIVIVSPQYVTILFVPIVLLLAMGVHTLISYWYQLFPRNPYARIVGLVPLTILIVSMTLSGIERYMYGYHYDPMIARNFSQDLRLLNKEIRKHDKIVLVVDRNEKLFYDVVAKYNPKLAVSTTQPAEGTPILISHAAATLRPAGVTPESIITDRQSTDADRFYLYKNSSK